MLNFSIFLSFCLFLYSIFLIFSHYQLVSISSNLFFLFLLSKITAIHNLYALHFNSRFQSCTVGWDDFKNQGWIICKDLQRCEHFFFKGSLMWNFENTIFKVTEHRAWWIESKKYSGIMFSFLNKAIPHLWPSLCTCSKNIFNLTLFNTTNSSLPLFLKFFRPSLWFSHSFLRFSIPLLFLSFPLYLSLY